MEQPFPRHERIRFRPEEIVDLSTLPSAADRPAVRTRPRPLRRVFRATAWVASACLVVVCLAWVSLNALGSSDFVSNQLRGRVEGLIRQAAGPGVVSRIGPARLAVDAGNLVSLDFDKIGLASAASQQPFLEARQLAFGLRFWPLMFGRVELANASIDGARVAVGGMGGGNANWADAIRDERGLVDPDKLLRITFAGLERFVAAVRSGSTEQVRIRDLAFENAGQPAGEILRIVDATVASAGDAVTLTGRAEVGGTSFSFAGNVAARQGRPLSAFEFSVIVDDSNSDSAPVFRIEGTPATATAAGQLRVAMQRRQQVINLGPRGPVTGDLDLLASLVEGSGKLEIERLDVAIGRSRVAFNGAIGPVPASLQGSALPAYRYELVSGESVIAPMDSPEPAMQAAIRVAGDITSDMRRIDLDQIGLRASSGEAKGSGSINLVAGKSPAILLDLGVEGMSVPQVKQLWPWIAAPNTRRWVMQNFFGGNVTRGSIHYNVAAGRLDRGGKLGPDELSGRFAVQGSRFDTTGRLPPIRDANGEIGFAGSQVDIALSTGTAYMNSGRSVAAKNGTMQIRDTPGSPLIGKMELDVSGAADAMAELATFEPIAVLPKIGLTPEDFTGDVEGHVIADIPLQKGIDRSKLSWLVNLDYRNLSIAKPMEGQKVTDAAGSIKLDPRQALIDAKARLNGIPAEIAIRRPIGQSGVEPQQQVELLLDDKTRAAIAPGLSSIVSGPIKVQAQKGDGSGQEVVADLTDAKLSLPWVGWSKGAGIPAKASFDLAADGGAQRLGNFKLQGKTFSARGSIVVDGGALQSAKFENVTLNSDDNMAVNIRRAGRGYAISLSGSALDARALIKTINDTNSGSSKGGSGSVELDAKLDRLIGFGNEALTGVSLRYSGSASGVASMTLSGSTDTGAQVRIENASSGGQRRVSATSADAGSLLRFLNIYGRVRGGTLKLSLEGQKILSGRLDVRDFSVIDEPKLSSLVSSPPPGGDRSLSQATKARIDTSRVKFDRAYAELAQGDGALRIANGVLRGPVIGTTFQGTAYDKRGRMDMTGTFMPAYGINSIFGDIPVLGAFLGNGRDGGLIGLTYRLRGDAKAPTLEVNPLSVIAPGIFRSIFEF